MATLPAEDALAAALGRLSDLDARRLLARLAEVAPEQVRQALASVAVAATGAGTAEEEAVAVHRRKRQRVAPAGSGGEVAGEGDGVATAAAAAAPTPTHAGNGGQAAAVASAALGSTAATILPSAPAEPPRMSGKAAAAARRASQSSASPASRGFDMSRFRLRHVALHVLYLGHAYHGFASQELPGGKGGKGGSAGHKPEPSAGRSTAVGGAAASQGEGAEGHLSTVESHLFAALTRACLIDSRDTCGYTRCGRTDRGVSAGGQVIALRLRSKARRFDLKDAGTAHTHAAEADGDVAMASPPPTGSAAMPAAGVVAALRLAQAGGAEGTAGDDDGEADDIAACHWRPWQRGDGLANTGDAFPPPSEETDFAFTLNNLLPPDIRVLGWADVGDDFSARFSATVRVYRYFFPARDLDLAAMADAGARLVGVHDFRNLCKVDLMNTQNFVREVLSVRIVRAGSEDVAGGFLGRAFEVQGVAPPAAAHTEPTASLGAAAVDAAAAVAAGGSPSDMWYIEVVGRAFMWHQIRCVAAVLFHVGRGYEAPAVVDHLLDVRACAARPQYGMAAEGPLLLMHCGFGEEEQGEGEEEPGVRATEASAGALAAAAGDDDSDSVGGADQPARFVRRDVSLFARMQHSPLALKRVTLDLEEQWAALAVKADMTRALLARVHALPVQRAAVAAALRRGKGEPSGAATDMLAGIGPGSAPSDAMRWGDALRLYGGAAAAHAGLKPLAWAADVDYVIQGLPADAAAPAGSSSAGSGGNYKPFAVRATGLSVAQRWAALPDAAKARIHAIHPVNAPKLQAEMDALAAAGAGEAGVGATSAAARDSSAEL